MSETPSLRLLRLLLVCGGLATTACDEPTAPPSAGTAPSLVQSKPAAAPPGAESRALVAEAQTAAAAPSAAPKPSSVRGRYDTWRPLLEEAWRAEVDAGGLLIDFGTPDQLKFTRAGWDNGWGDSKADPTGVSYVSASSRTVPLRVVLPDAPITQVYARARSGLRKQVVALMTGDGKEVGQADIGTDWDTAKLRLAKIRPDAKASELKLYFRQGKGKTVRGEIDWLWLGTSDGEPPPVAPRVLPIRVGERTRRALTAPSPRQYLFYMHVPEDGRLVFDYGAEVSATFTVSVRTDTAGVKQLWRQTAEIGQWKEGVVDLSAYAGRAVRLELATEGENGVVGWGEPEIVIPPRDPVAAGDRTPAKNVVVILIDTARYDAFETFNKGAKVQTPSHDQFASGATIFERAYNNENWTKPSVATVLSGLYPATHQVKTHTAVVPDDVELISERLGKHGFKTGAFIANGYCGKVFGFGQGWDFYRNYIRENRKSEAEYVYRDALEWIDEHKGERFLAYVQTIDPHVVYRVPTEYTARYHPEPYTGLIGQALDGHVQADISQGKKKIKEADYDWIRALYYGELTYHDEHMGKFLDALKARGLFEDTLFVITNDHGEELNDHGRLGHGHSLYEHMIRAPLMLRYPPFFPQGHRIEEVVENVDVFPTVLEVLGLPPSKDVEGHSLLAWLDDTPVKRPSYAVIEFLDNRRALRVGRWKLMTSTGAMNKLYDVVDDPDENNDLFDARPLARRLTETYLVEALMSPDKSKRGAIAARTRKFKAGNAKIDPELKAQLDALGYFGD